MLTALLEPDDRVRWIGNAVFAALAVALVAITTVASRSGRRSAIMRLSVTQTRRS